MQPSSLNSLMASLAQWEAGTSERAVREPGNPDWFSGTRCIRCFLYPHRKAGEVVHSDCDGVSGNGAARFTH